MSFLSWCTCQIAVLFSDMKRFIDRSVGVYFLAHLYICELKLYWLDLTINADKSAFVTCSYITTIAGHVLTWCNEVRYM